ncbi:sensor histidine kinase [Pedobacter heparinus]|uniref:histidine kinase n=1 Tax=Pedobacter heparinus (strain ATCC 13125 / DSM 2366 / CIP 104194 / JCM 7457 / NBRC 12017 / NCIMB 9290 / NRRL B-14731 / HIM 762-3) TaxID=485917 RepID=C6XUS5_PEDHD|nr:sensor histidine kinase [Pedobacter heparinus]ACU03925.1 ATP-binding region ATPase domain protein [Pedobacter heparinus DSM 2366]
MRYALILLVYLASFSGGYAQPLINLNDSSPYSNIGRSVSYLEDKTGGLNLAAVKALDKGGRFLKSDAEILAFGNRRSAFWMKLNYFNKSDGKAFLVIDVPNVESIDLYADLPGGHQLHLHTGSLSVKMKRVVASNNYIFDLGGADDIHPGIQTVYIRVKTNNILLLPVKLVTAETLIAESALKTRFEAMYIGALIILFFFNLFLYLSFKDHIYFIYSIYVGSLFIYLIFYIRGYGYVFGTNFRAFINLYPHIFLSVSCLASALFSINYLELKKRIPGVIRIYNVLIFCWLVILVLSILGYKSAISGIVNYLLMLSSVFLWINGFLSYRTGHKAALYYILAWAFVCIPILFVTLTLSGVFAYHDYTFYIVPAGTTIELLLLSFALGDRFNTIRKQNIRLITTQKERLEKLVQGRTLKLNESVKMLKERTLKLNETIETLEETNAVKNKLFSIIAHDLRSPFNSLLSIFSLKDMNLLTFEDLKMLLNESRKSIDTIHNTLNNLLYWAKSQMEGVTAFPSNLDLKEMISNLLLVYQPLITRKSIGIAFLADQHIEVYADENQIQLVMRNLIDNAIKFTPFQQNITISLKKDATHAHIIVTNPVSGAVAINQDTFSSGKIHNPAYGTANEKGVGLGLHLCREYIQQNGGELIVELRSDQVSFSFSLPIAM